MTSTSPDTSDAALGRDLVAAAVLRGDFLLRSGQRSSYYIDKYLFTTQPDLLRRIGTALATIVPQGVDRLAGPALGAVPLLAALSLQVNLPFVIVRAERPKEYGTAKQIEGALSVGERVWLVEDVVTTGGASMTSIEILQEAGATVIGAVCVVDREQGGAEAFAARSVPFRALFTKTSLGL
jgi:orotate phosphoribosyltransferase